MLRTIPRNRLSYIMAPVIVGLLLLAGFALSRENPAVSAAQPGTSVSLIMPDQAYVGELIRVKLIVNDAQNLAGYQGTVNYSADNLHLGGIKFSQDLARSGRDIMPLTPVERAASVVLGAVTCPVSNCSTPQYDSSPRQDQGVDGYVELATLELVAQAPGQYQFVLEDVQLVDPLANQLGAVVLNNVLDVSSR